MEKGIEFSKLSSRQKEVLEYVVNNAIKRGDFKTILNSKERAEGHNVGDQVIDILRDDYKLNLDFNKSKIYLYIDINDLRYIRTLLDSLHYQFQEEGVISIHNNEGINDMYHFIFDRLDLDMFEPIQYHDKESNTDFYEDPFTNEIIHKDKG